MGLVWAPRGWPAMVLWLGGVKQGPWNPHGIVLHVWFLQVAEQTCALT